MKSGIHRLRAVVIERDYSVVAQIPGEDEQGERVPRSDRLATAFRLQEEVVSRGGRKPAILDDGHVVEAMMDLGDATDEEFDEAGSLMLEAASSW